MSANNPASCVWCWWVIKLRRWDLSDGTAIAMRDTYSFRVKKSKFFTLHFEASSPWQYPFKDIFLTWQCPFQWRYIKMKLFQVYRSVQNEAISIFKPPATGDPSHTSLSNHQTKYRITKLGSGTNLFCWINQPFHWVILSIHPISITSSC